MLFVRVCYMRPIHVGVHGAELEEHKVTAAPTDARRLIKHRPGRGKFHQQGDDQHSGSKKEESKRRRYDVKGPLDELLTLGEGQRTKLDQRQSILIDDVDPARLRCEVNRAIDDDPHPLEYLVAFVQLTP